MDRMRLFEPLEIAGLRLKSRLVRSATAERIAVETPEQAQRLGEKYAELARGQVGLVITGHIAVDPSGRAHPFMPGLYADRHIPLWNKVIEVASGSGALVCAQINHGGGRCKAENAGSDPALFPHPICVSVCDRPRDAMAGHELTEADIEAMIGAYAAAASRARKAGFHAVQIHAAHGYLASQFLSPTSNRRNDAWGGSLDNRARFARSVTRAVRQAVGEDFPLGMKLGVMDEEGSGGLTLDETLQLVKWFEDDGLNFLEVSGAFRSDVISRNVRAGKGEAYYLEAARRVKEVLRIPVFAVGGFRTLAAIEQALASGGCDAISMSRSLIRQPNASEVLRTRGQFDCKGCNLCILRSNGDTHCHAVEQQG